MGYIIVYLQSLLFLNLLRFFCTKCIGYSHLKILSTSMYFVLTYKTIHCTTSYAIHTRKGKGHPSTGRGGPRSSGYVKAPDFLDDRHYKGRQPYAPTDFTLYKEKSLVVISEVESTPGHMVTSETRKKFPAIPAGIDPGTIRLVAQCLNHYATPGPIHIGILTTYQM